MQLTEAVLNILAPFNCIGCGREGTILCQGCLQSEVLPLPSRCFLCQATTKEFATCTNCRQKSGLNHVWICADYSDLAKHLMTKLKFGRASAASRVIAGHMADTLPNLEDTLITYVPTATGRVRQRGFDQSKLIARELSFVTGWPMAPLLARLSQSRQVGAGRQQRAKQLAEAFYVVNPFMIKSAKHILLVDDITTTGATLSAAAKSLKASGAKKISAIVFAQKNL
ncbi:MAG: phosphoribosyltransferase family protein [Patescibacteria group bacterium]